jgi:glycosyltransferase involved in cell wall biosynthesis
MPKLSVIVPVYNTEKYLRECIDSILAQTFTDFELILVDDGSTDGSGVICDEYAGKDPRIQVIHQPNAGVTNARKSGVRRACGMYFSFIDSDDWIHPEMFERMVEKCVEANTDMVVCDVCLEYEAKTEFLSSLTEEGFYHKDELCEKIYPTMLMDIRFRRPGILGSSCNKIFHRKVLDKVFWQVDDSFVYAEDALFCYAALLESNSVFVLRRPLYHYRQHSESAMHQYNGKRYYENALRSYYAFQGFLQNRGFEMSKQLSVYIAVNAVDVIRRVLLFDKETALRIRLKQARDFVSDELVYAALCDNIKNLQSRRDQWKTMLAKRRCVTFLYLFFAARECMLHVK